MHAALRFLEGKKTYLTAAALGVAGILLGLGKISQDEFNTFASITIPMALAFLRQAVAKAERS